MHLIFNNKYYLNYFGHVHYYKSYLKVQACCSMPREKPVPYVPSLTNIN